MLKQGAGPRRGPALKDLAEAGICVDVQAMHFTYPWSDLERVAEVVEREKHTLYGAQLQVGLAQAFLWFAEGQLGSSPTQRWVAAATATLDRVKPLVAHELPVDIGLERTFKLLRERVARADRRATESRKALEHSSGY